MRRYFVAGGGAADRFEHPQGPGALPDPLCRGGSVIVSPLGEVLAGPLWGEEGILRAQLDLREIVRSRLDFDPAGHYARHDVFAFDVRDQPEPVHVEVADE